MKIFGQGAMSYFLSRMSYFPYFMILTEVWRKLNISVRKSVAFLFPCLLLLREQKRNEYDEKDWKIKRMADVAGWLCDGDNFL